MSTKNRFFHLRIALVILLLTTHSTAAHYSPNGSVTTLIDDIEAAIASPDDDVIDLGSDFGPNIDLTFGYTLVADGSGGFGFDFAIGGAVPQAAPEPSTWAMMLIGFVGVGFAGHRSAQAGRRGSVSCG